MMEHLSASFLPALNQMFPAMPDDILLATLDAHNNSVEDAINALLEMCSGNGEEVGASASSALTDITDGSRTTDGKGRRESQNSSTNNVKKAQQRKCDLASTGKDLLPPPSTPKPRHAPASALPASSTKHHLTITSSSNTSHGTASVPRVTWGQLQPNPPRNQSHQSQRHQPSQYDVGTVTYRPPPPFDPPSAALYGPKYVAPGVGSERCLADVEFPELARGGAVTGLGPAAQQQRQKSSLQQPPAIHLSNSPTRTYSASALQDLETRTGSLSFTTSRVCAVRGGSARCAVAAGPPQTPLAPPPPRPSGGYAAAARHVPHQPKRPASGCPVQSAGRGHDEVYGGGNYADDAGWRAAALEELCHAHVWAERELVEAIFTALQYDLTEVVAALDELNAASYQYSSSSGSASTTSTSCDSDPEDEGAEEEDAGSGDVAAVDPYDFTAQRGVTAANRRRHRHDEATGSDGDPYFRHRRSALKLDHAWRKKLSKASAAFTTGDRALGQRLVSEAKQLRRQAAAAHQEAAERIVREMNQDRQLSEWELDLHGLHASEAIEVLAKRIAALEGSPPTRAAVAAVAPVDPAATAMAPAVAPTPGGGGGSSSSNSGGGGGRPKRQHKNGQHQSSVIAPSQQLTPIATAEALATASAETCSDATSKSLASRRVLRVIVGKGLHSSGGEASLPRVVEGYLVERGYRFYPLAGVIEVQMRRPFTIRTTTAAAAAATGR